MFLVGRASLVSSYVGSHKSGTPQPSLDVDANRLVLLDRLESDQPENGETSRSNLINVRQYRSGAKVPLLYLLMSLSRDLQTDSLLVVGGWYIICSNVLVECGEVSLW